ncbi:hypothetical protein STAL104432_32175 [Streptomyces albus]
MRSASVPSASFWKSPAEAVETVRPLRATSVRMVAGPATVAVR